MAKLLGIGGIFIYAKNAEQLDGWYSHHLGFSFDEMSEADRPPTYYQVLTHRDLEHPDKMHHTMFAIMPARSELSEARNQAMLNYCIDDMDAFIEQLNAAGIATDPVEIWADGEGGGKFTHLYDPEGNRIELWQPSDLQSLF